MTSDNRTIIPSVSQIIPIFAVSKCIHIFKYIPSGNMGIRAKVLQIYNFNEMNKYEGNSLSKSQKTGT